MGIGDGEVDVDFASWLLIRLLAPAPGGPRRSGSRAGSRRRRADRSGVSTTSMLRKWYGAGGRWARPRRPTPDVRGAGAVLRLPHPPSTGRRFRRKVSRRRPDSMPGSPHGPAGSTVRSRRNHRSADWRSTCRAGQAPAATCGRRRAAAGTSEKDGSVLETSSRPAAPRVPRSRHDRFGRPGPADTEATDQGVTRGPPSCPSDAASALWACSQGATQRTGPKSSHHRILPILPGRRVENELAHPQGVPQAAGGGIEVTVDLQGTDQAVAVPTPCGDEVLVDPREHREDVIRRLLGLGVTPRCLRTLLPGWSLLITRVARALAVEEGDRVLPDRDADG